MFDIFFLSETFVEGKFYEHEGRFKGFQLHWQAAVRNHVRGRASGGFLIGIKSTLLNTIPCQVFKGVFSLLSRFLDTF